MANIIEDIYLENPQWTTKQIQEETKRRGAKDGHGYSKRQIRRRLSSLKNGAIDKTINSSERKEEITRDKPNVSEDALADLKEDGIIISDIKTGFGDDRVNFYWSVEDINTRLFPSDIFELKHEHFLVTW